MWNEHKQEQFFKIASDYVCANFKHIFFTLQFHVKSGV